MLQMMGEYEPSVPNTRRQKQRATRVDPETGERLQKPKTERKERVKTKKELQRERAVAREKAFWDNI